MSGTRPSHDQNAANCVADDSHEQVSGVKLERHSNCRQGDVRHDQINTAKVVPLFDVAGRNMESGEGPSHLPLPMPPRATSVLTYLRTGSFAALA